METKAIRGIPWTLLAFASTKAVSLITTLVLARLLVPSDFGVVAFAGLAMALLSQISELGLTPALIVRHDFDRAAQRTVFGMLLALNVAGAVLLAALAPLIAEIFGDDRVMEVVLLMCIPLLVGGVTSFYWALLQRELEFRRNFACQAAQVVVMPVVAIPMAAAGAGLWSLVVGQIAAALAYTAALVILAPYRVSPAFSRDVGEEAWKSGRGFLAQGGVTWVEQNADYLLVGSQLGARPLGLYSTAYRLGEIPYTGIANPIADVTFPAFSRMRHRDESVKGPFLTALGLVALVACPLGVLLSGAAEPFVDAVLGSKWTDMAGILTVLGLWGAVRPVQGTIGWLLNSMEHSGALARVYLFILVASIPALVLATELSGIVAVGWVMVASMVVMTGIVANMTAAKVGVSLREQWGAVQAVVIACPVAWGAARGVAELSADAAPGIALALSLAAGAAAYALVVRLVDPGMLRNARAQLRRLAQKGAQTEAPEPPAVVIK